MVAVVAPADDVQVEVELGRRRDPKGVAHVPDGVVLAGNPFSSFDSIGTT
jgi:hypothetical protein